MSNQIRIIELTEYKTIRIPFDQLSEDEARIINKHYSKKINLEPATFLNDNTWGLTSLGWVGYLPIHPQFGISLQPKTSLSNLLRMLEYAYDLSSFEFLHGRFDCESLQEFYDRLANLLAKRVLLRFRNGLYKEYIAETDTLSYVRGSICFNELLKKPIGETITCAYEEQTVDNTDNRIICWTLHRIIRSGLCSSSARDAVRKADNVLKHTVTLTPYSADDCISREYNRLNADYDVLHKLCRFFLDNSGPTQTAGPTSMIPFAVNMARLFELFVALWMQENLDKSKYTLGTQKSIHLDENSEMKFIMDLVIFNAADHTPLVVLDTKYKVHDSATMQDYAQVLTYAENIGCTEAVLVYPAELATPLNIKKNRIRVRGLAFNLGMDLNEAGEKFLGDLLDDV